MDQHLDLIFVDDERDMELLSEMNFKKAITKGFVDFHFFESARDCLRYLRAPHGQGPCLVITDINMPEATGFELLEGIKKDFPAIQVFMMSAYDDLENKRRSVDMGASAYFVKPVSYKNIKNKISEEYGIPL